MGTRKSKPGIQAPQLGKSLQPAQLPRDLPTEHETFSGLEYLHLDLSERAISRLHFQEVIFTQLLATGSALDHLRMEDARLVSCNLANAVWHNLACTRVEFTGCRMTGFATLEAELHDTLFKDCKLDLAQFYGAKMLAARFEDCPLQGSDFRNADLSGAALIRCDLTGADFTGAKLAGVDLRTCRIDGMRAGPTELRGATVDDAQALALVRAMGVIVE